jgi:hypothetical protein
VNRSQSCEQRDIYNERKDDAKERVELLGFHIRRPYSKWHSEFNAKIGLAQSIADLVKEHRA